MAANLAPAQSPLTPAPQGIMGILAGDPQREADLGQKEQATEDKIESAEKEKAGLRPPELQTVPPPVPKSTDPKEMWGSAAMMLAGIGSLFTRNHMTTALNAASQVFNAYHQKDQLAANTAYQTWKVANENALKSAEFQQKTYEAALKKSDSDEKGALAEFTAAAHAFQDTTAVQQAQINGIKGVEQLIIERGRLRLAIAEAKPKLEEAHAQWDAYLGLQSAHKALQAAQASKNPAKIKEAQSQFDDALNNAKDLAMSQGKDMSAASAVGDPADDAYIKAVANYKVAPPSSGRNPAQRQAVIDAVLKVNPKYDETKYAAANQAQKAFGSGKQGDIARSLNVSVSHLETLRALGAALQNGDVSAINAAKQQFSEEFGVPAPTNFDTAKSIVADEVAKGVIGGQSAQSDRETLADSLRRERSPQAINGAIDTFQALLGGQLKGLRGQYERTTGATDFDDAFMEPGTRAALERYSGGAKNPPTVTTKEEYDALPSGSTFIESGKKYRKP